MGVSGPEGGWPGYQVNLRLRDVQTIGSMIGSETDLGPGPMSSRLTPMNPKPKWSYSAFSGQVRSGQQNSYRPKFSTIGSEATVYSEMEGDPGRSPLENKQDQDLV